MWDCVCMDTFNSGVCVCDLREQIMMWNTEEQQKNQTEKEEKVGSAVLVWKIGHFSNTEWFIEMS